MFTSDCIAYKNTVEITPKESTRKEMVRIVQQDDGTGGSYIAKPQNNREYGGYIATNGKVVESNPGPVRNLENATYAFISIESPSGASTFHSHPSGEIFEDSTKNNSYIGSSSTIGGTTKNSMYNNAPSYKYTDEKGIEKIAGDVPNAELTIEYVFARRNETVYIYNKTGVLATIPHEYFVNFKTKK